MELFLIYIRKFFFSKRHEWLKFDFIFMYLGIIISVAALCTTLIIFEGYETTLKKTILGVNSHVYFFQPGTSDLTQADYDTISAFLDEKPEVNSYSGVISGQSVVAFQNRSKGAFYKSVDWESDHETSIYRAAVNEGEWRLLNEDDIVIGKYLAQSLNAKIGDEISVMSTSSVVMGLTGLSYRTRRMKIVGIFYCGMYEYDSRYIFMNTASARHFNATSSDYTLIEVQLKPDYIDQAIDYSIDWDYALDQRYQVTSWIMFNGNLFSLLTLEKWVLSIIISFLIIVASFNVTTTTLAFISEKRKEIGLLKTIGLNSRKIAYLFLTQINLFSSVCVVLGIFTGIGMGYLISYQTMISLRGEVYLLDKIYIYVDVFKMLLIFAVAMTIINVASVFPLRQITKLKEIDILRVKR